MKNTEKPTPDRAEIIAYPAVIFGIALGICFLLHFFLPWVFPNSWWVSAAIGLVLLLVAGVVVNLAMQKFISAKTAILPSKPATQIVNTGIYAHTRNPMYIGIGLIFLSAGFILHTVWCLVLFFPLMLVLHYGVVRKEEKYLARKFGQPYIDYKKQVRRWL